MSVKTLDLKLSSLVFDRSHPALQRDRIGPIEDRDPSYDDRYDFQTLIYDCYFDPEENTVSLITPKLLNFENLLLAASIEIDGIPAKIKAIQKLSRGNCVQISSPVRNPKNIRITHELFNKALKINSLHLDAFAGKNVVYAISKNNNLSWISDWLTYYVKEHGANAVVIYDNQSTDYSMEKLKDKLASVKGLDAVAVVRAWFPFGPGGIGQTNFSSKFLHMTMVELGRRRLLSKARAVLNVDIDELVYSKSGLSIFDETVASENGFIRFGGEWVYAAPPKTGRTLRHSSHRYTCSEGPRVNPKWCVSAQGPLKGHAWLTHRVAGTPLRGSKTKEFAYWHFRRLTNSWDYDRDGFDRSTMIKEGRLIKTMTRLFPKKKKLQKT